MLSDTLDRVARIAEQTLADLGVSQETPTATWRMIASKRKASDVLAVLAGKLRESETVFDAKALKLNCPNGVVDLKTGRIRPHKTSDRFRLQTGVDYVPGAKSAVWDRALSAVDPSVLAWLRLRFGQALTGRQPEDHRILFLKGGGENGKSVIIDSVMSALGNYAANIPPKVLLANPSDHSTERMTLMGCRLAVIEELPEQHISGVMLKQLVGIKSITARFIARNNVTFPVTWSLMLTTNYTPRISDTDHGTWRRIAAVPFPFRFVKDPVMPHERSRDSSLQRWKDDPSEAVLAWLVAACRDALADPIAFAEVPEAVETETAAIRGENDLVGQYAEDRLVLDQSATVSKLEVFNDYQMWANRVGQRPIQINTFAQRFKETEVGRNVDPNVRVGNIRMWGGVRLRERLAIVNNPYDGQVKP